MTPKMSESPAASRKRSIPKEMPLRAWMIQKVMGSLAPDLSRGLCDQLELPALIVQRQQVPGSHRRKAALGTDRQVLERHVSRSFIDPAQKGVAGLEPRLLGRDPAQHHGLPATPFCAGS